MKTYVLIVSQRFPAKHPRKGDLTMFIENILNGSKIHTIRNNYPLWKKRIDEVSAGKAVISIRVWSGLPYRSPQEEITTLTREHGVGVQKLTTKDGHHEIDDFFRIGEVYDVFAKNDGLSEIDFFEWFREVKLNTDLAIIHFTNFRY